MNIYAVLLVDDYCQWIIEQPDMFVLHIPCMISLVSI